MGYSQGTLLRLPSSRLAQMLKDFPADVRHQPEKSLRRLSWMSLEIKRIVRRFTSLRVFYNKTLNPKP